MIKKVVSMVVAVSMIIMAMTGISSMARESEISKLDLSAYNAGDAYKATGSNALVVEEDSAKAALIGKKGEAYTIGEIETTLGDTLAAKNADGLLPTGTKGVVINTTFKLTSTSPQILLTPSTVYPRYIDIVGGVIKYSPSSGAAYTSSINVSAGVWYDLQFMLNYETGYLKIAVKNLETDKTTTHTATVAGFVLTEEKIAAISTIKWWHTSNASGNMIISKYDVYAEDNSEAIAPSKIVVRDNFDGATSTVSSPWTSTTTEVISTDRGQSAVIGKGYKQYLYIRNAAGSPILPTSAKGMVSEFSVKFTGTEKHGFIYALNDSSNNYWSTNLNLIKFSSGGKIQVNGNKSEWGTWVKDKWYDIKIEYNFTAKTIRYTIYDGTTEKTAVYTNAYTNYDDLSGKVQLQFVSESQTADQNILIDDVNIYWIDELTASGITSGKDTVSVNNNFEKFAEGTEAIEADMTCGAPTSFIKSGSKPDAAQYSIESVVNSGRGKSFKVAADLEPGQDTAFYKDFSAIQNGVVSFDIMFESTDGLTIVNAQASDKSNGNMSKTMVFRFDNWGNIKDANNKNVLGLYEAKKWYKVVLTAGIYDGISGIKYQIYSDSALVAESITPTGTSSVVRDSVRYAQISMHDYDNTLYVDNYKAYAPSDVAYGISPVSEMMKKRSELTSENKIQLAFNKAVDLSKSSFKVNGEEVSAKGNEIITLNKEIVSGETYDIEYKVYDLDGFRIFGYVPGIKGVDIYNISDFTPATLENPGASVKVSIGKGATPKTISLIVASYNENELVSVRMDSKTVGTEEAEFVAAVSADGADTVKTFLWNDSNLTPLN